MKNVGHHQTASWALSIVKNLMDNFCALSVSLEMKKIENSRPSTKLTVAPGFMLLKHFIRRGKGRVNIFLKTKYSKSNVESSDLLS